MKALILKTIISLNVLLLCVSNQASAQTMASESNFKSKLATVIFVGLGGAVLGLSTLSFYGEPEEHISNITTGFALGILAGTSYVIYDSAANSGSSTAWIQELKKIEAQNKSNLNLSIYKTVFYKWDWNF